MLIGQLKSIGLELSLKMLTIHRLPKYDLKKIMIELLEGAKCHTNYATDHEYSKRNPSMIY
jgi:hypothetical protein